MARRAMLRLRVRPGMEEEYRTAHQVVWPSVLDACRRSGVRNYTIFIDGRDVYAYFEAVDVQAALHKLAREPEIKHWQERMRPLLEVQLDAGAAALLEEVFHLD